MGARQAFPQLFLSGVAEFLKPAEFLAITGTRMSKLIVADADSARDLQDLRRAGHLNSVAFAPNGELIAIDRNDERLRLVETSSDRVLVDQSLCPSGCEFGSGRPASSSDT